MVRCSILGCNSDSERKLPDLSFHSFPTNDNVRLQWIKATGRKNWTPKNSSRICSTHFDKNVVCKKNKLTILSPNAVPLLTSPYTKLIKLKEPYNKKHIQYNINVPGPSTSSQVPGSTVINNNELIENTDSSRLGTDDTNVSETEEVINPRKAMKRPYSKSHEDHRPEKFQHGDYIIQDGDYKIQDGDSKIQDGDETQVNEECDILTKLWARKLRRLPEDRRDYVIYTINNLIYKECIDSRANASPNRVSPVQMYKEEPFSEENMDSPTNNLDSKELDIALFEESDVFITKMEPQSP